MKRIKTTISNSPLLAIQVSGLMLFISSCKQRSIAGKNGKVGAASRLGRKSSFACGKAYFRPKPCLIFPYIREGAYKVKRKRRFNLFGSGGRQTAVTICLFAIRSIQTFGQCRQCNGTGFKGGARLCFGRPKPPCPSLTAVGVHSRWSHSNVMKKGGLS
jgi:hypothetical protein